MLEKSGRRRGDRSRSRLDGFLEHIKAKSADSKWWQLVGTILGVIGVLLAAAAGIVRALGLLVHRARETLIGLEPLVYPERELLLTGLNAFWQLPWRSLSSLSSSHEFLSWSSWGFLLLSVAVLAGVKQGRQLRRGFPLLPLFILSITTMLLFVGATFMTIAVRAQNVATDAGRNDGLCASTLSENWADLVAYESCSWLTNGGTRNDERRQSLGGIPLWLMLAVVCSGIALSRCQPLARPRWRRWRIALGLALSLIGLLVLGIWPAAHAYATWGMKYPQVELVARAGCDHPHRLVAANAAGMCCAYDVTDVASRNGENVLRLIGSGCPPSFEGTLVTDKRCIVKILGEDRVFTQECGSK